MPIQRKRKTQLQKKRIQKSVNKELENSQNQKLYEALICIYKLTQWNDLLFLKSSYFLELCEVNWIHWDFNRSRLEEEDLEINKKAYWPFQFPCALSCKDQVYGELVFFSSQKFSQKKKNFLKKISFFTSSTLYFIENKEKMETLKNQWGGAFDSFSQAFCITDKNFKIIRSNQAFEKISRQKISKPTNKNLFSKNLFELIPAPSFLPKNEGSFFTEIKREGKSLGLEISFKALFLKKEKIQAYLFLIKDVTEEMEMEKKLSSQTKERELGLIKGSVAHELNNPVAGIKTLLDVIVKKENFPNPIKNSLQDMQEAISRCQKIIEQLLFVSQKSKEKSPS